MSNLLLAIIVSLLSCSPGEELYSRYGHTAIRIQDTELATDYVYNYGLFSFEEGGFYWHFVQGQTWYELGVQPYPMFAYEYQMEHRTVNEQVLNLTDQQKVFLQDALTENLKPFNRKYLYNFVFDNCATRPYHLLQTVFHDSLTSTYTGWEGATYRQFIHHYTRHGSWAEFAINLVFGYKADQTISGEQRLFLPEALMYWIQEAQRPDGQPLTCHLSPVTCHLSPFIPQPVPWYKTWYLGMVLLFLLVAGISFWDRKRGKRSKWLDIILYIYYGLMTALLIFLIFFSIHPLVSIGWFVFIIPAIHLCGRLIYIWR